MVIRAQLLRTLPWLILIAVVVLAACDPGSTAPGY